MLKNCIERVSTGLNPRASKGQLPACAGNSPPARALDPVRALDGLCLRPRRREIAPLKPCRSGQGGFLHSFSERSSVPQKRRGAFLCPPPKIKQAFGEQKRPGSRLTCVRCRLVPMLWPGGSPYRLSWGDPERSGPGGRRPARRISAGVGRLAQMRAGSGGSSASHCF